MSKRRVKKTPLESTPEPTEEMPPEEITAKPEEKAKMELLTAAAPEESEPPTPQPEEVQKPKGEGNFWVLCEAIDRSILCEDQQVPGHVKMIVSRLPVDGEIVVKRVK